MVNYLSRDYFLRFHVSPHSKIDLFPRTVGLLRSLTNQVKVTLYYDTDEEGALQHCADLLSEYRLVNPRITVQTVDYMRDPGLAQTVKAKYRQPLRPDRQESRHLRLRGEGEGGRWQCAGPLCLRAGAK